ncbi:translation elongation factor 4 [Engelhardtia mirabilis]|uniref:Elongation factor 4 n=1 Tax=Engelhardtia mirabilis TaxID=2528011 RepID=A0A518BFG8_9BACT|nr:Elongation factor 4 [Planctomycetes bacterium Pla133]QDV00056.1 Elongation factor 4 [Planctomycetes bacterium Pla86]
MDPKHIRNFSIIAHIDHGKSTLADRMLEITGTIDKRRMRDRLLDDMDLERERGITIKARAVTIYHVKDGEKYQLNLIDTPGHVDFNYEVEKSLQACEGALLLVDASQGVEAQTVANAYLAIEANLEIIPVLNKIDLPHARPDEIAEEIENSLGLDGTNALAVSAKTGAGVSEVLDALVEQVPAPTGDPAAPLRALIFDAVYDEFRGIIVYLRVFDGTIREKERIRMMSAGKVFEALEVGRFNPKMDRSGALGAGEVGYFISNIKTLGDVAVGDTLTLDKGPVVKPLPGYRPAVHMVYADFYPTNNGDFEELREALSTLKLSDSALDFAPVTSDALGFGFRCGFLGLLHMEIVQQRLEREHDLDLIQTAPTVTYRIVNHDGSEREIHSPGQLPDPDKFESILEPIARVSIMVPAEYIGTVMQIAIEHRGVYVRQEYVSATRVQLTYDIPMAEIIYDFYDKLKSSTRGYGTMNYELLDFQAGDLVKLRVLVNSADVDALSSICHKDQADYRGRQTIKKLRKEIPRHMFEVPLQAAVGGRIIARETIRAMRKDVTAKCYGGDITRKRKLLEKQKAGKRRMRSVGNVDIPQKAFLAVLGDKE